jgi:hypothetical protein
MVGILSVAAANWLSGVNNLSVSSSFAPLNLTEPSA